MKYLVGTLIVLLLVACGGSEKKTLETTTQVTEKYTYISPTQEMLDSGKVTFDQYCQICHKDGIGGAAKLTNKTRWEVNRTKDLEQLVQNVHDGFTGNYGTMTPMGTCMECSKDDLRDAIFFMMNEAGVL